MAKNINTKTGDKAEADAPIEKSLEKSTSALSLLTLSAMAIQPSFHVHAAVAPTEKTLSIRYTQYQEDDVEAANLSGGDEQRYGIDVFQLRYVTPYENDYSVEGNAMFETMSGASAFSNNDNGDGTASVLMSGASIDESRLDMSGTLTKYNRYSTKAGTASVSKEKDYFSLSLGFSGSLENKSRSLTLLCSFSAAYDQLSPTDPELFLARQQADGENKKSVSAYMGFNRVLNKDSTLQMGLSATAYQGYLSDPYRIKDQRPDSRLQTAFSMQYRNYFSVANGLAWHLDYRYFQDDWQVIAHTIKSSVWLNVGSVTLVPNVRAYVQEEAEFYTLSAAPIADGLTQYSDDYRLSSYGALSVGLDLMWKLQGSTWHLGFSQYESKPEWGDGVIENPSLVNFTTLSFGVDYKY